MSPTPPVRRDLRSAYRRLPTRSGLLSMQADPHAPHRSVIRNRSAAVKNSIYLVLSRYPLAMAVPTSRTTSYAASRRSWQAESPGRSKLAGLEPSSDGFDSRCAHEFLARGQGRPEEGCAKAIPVAAAERLPERDQHSPLVERLVLGEEHRRVRIGLEQRSLTLVRRNRLNREVGAGRNDGVLLEHRIQRRPAGEVDRRDLGRTSKGNPVQVDRHGHIAEAAQSLELEDLRPRGDPKCVGLVSRRKRSSARRTRELTSSPRAAPSSLKLRSAFGGSPTGPSEATNEPRPVDDLMIPSPARAPSARRTVTLLTPSRSPIARSAGRRSPGLRAPLAISSAIKR